MKSVHGFFSSIRVTPCRSRLQFPIFIFLLGGGRRRRGAFFLTAHDHRFSLRMGTPLHPPCKNPRSRFTEGGCVAKTRVVTIRFEIV